MAWDAVEKFIFRPPTAGQQLWTPVAFVRRWKLTMHCFQYFVNMRVFAAEWARSWKVLASSIKQIYQGSMIGCREHFVPLQFCQHSPAKIRDGAAAFLVRPANMEIPVTPDGGRGTAAYAVSARSVTEPGSLIVPLRCSHLLFM